MNIFFYFISVYWSFKRMTDERLPKQNKYFFKQREDAFSVATKKLQRYPCWRRFPCVYRFALSSVKFINLYYTFSIQIATGESFLVIYSVIVNPIPEFLYEYTKARRSFNESGANIAIT